MKSITFRSAFLLLTAIAFAGCQPALRPEPESKGNVALIDIDDAATRLGRDVEIADELKAAGNPLGDQLMEIGKQLQGEFERAKESAGKTPSEDEIRKLAEFEQALNLRLQQEQQKAQQELNVKRVALINRFREEVRSVAMKIAAERGFGIVLMKSEITVLYSDPAFDITDEVVAELTRTGATPAEADASPTPN